MTRRGLGYALWVFIVAALLLAAAIQFGSGCCASTCQSMLGECERGLEDLHQQLASMCACGLPDYDDGGCALAAAGETP